MRKVSIIMILFFSFKKAISQTVDTVFVFKPPIEKNIKSMNLLDTIFINKSKSIIVSRYPVENDTVSVIAFNSEKEILYDGKYLLSKVDTIKAIYEYANGESKKQIRRLQFIFLREGYWNIYKKGKLRSIYYFEGEKLKLKI